MKYCAIIQTEFLKLAKTSWWDSLSQKQQRRYIYTHPGTHLRVTAPTEKSKEFKGFRTDYVGEKEYDRILKNPKAYAKKGISADIVTMTPQEYIDAVSVGFGEEQKPTIGGGLQAPKNIKTYAKLMDKDVKFPMTVLDYQDWPIGFGQEGRHRAYAAIKAGINEIPVMIVKKTKAS